MAGAYTDRWLDELRSRNSIVDVASQYTVLKQNGRKYVGLCPIHGEKTPSFNIDADKQLFYCFGCGKGGTVIQLVMECEHMSFHEAVEFLARRVNLPLPKSDIDEAELHRRQQKRDRLRALNRDAARFYYDTLVSPKGAPAREYLTGRHIGGAVARRFGLGFAPDEWNALTDALTRAGYTVEEMIEAGLAKKAESGTVYDAFRNRVMFPIIDSYSHCIGFGGRIMGKGEPKYLNSPESPVFDKGRNLYAINLVKKKGKIDYVILCEGYIDVISLHNAGFDTAVASLGTAFTAEQARLIKRFTQNVYLSYDGDNAGQKATDRALAILAAEDLKARVIVYPDGMDPDDFVKKRGADAMRALLRGALNEAQYRVERAGLHYDLKDPSVYADFAAEAVASVARIADPIMRETGLKLISDRTGYTLDTLYDQMGAKRTAFQGRANPPFVPGEPSRQHAAASSAAAEATALALAVDDKNYRARMKQDGWGDLFADKANRELFELICAEPDGEDVEAASLALKLTEEQNLLLSRVLVENVETANKARLYADCGRSLRQNRLTDRIARAKERLTTERDPETVRAVAAELQELNQKLQSLKRQGG